MYDMKAGFAEAKDAAEAAFMIYKVVATLQMSIYEMLQRKANLGAAIADDDDLAVLVDIDED